MPDLAAALEVLGAALVDVAGHEYPCPCCGMTPEVRAIAERKAALDRTLQAWLAHRARCQACMATPWGGCPPGRRLQDARFQAWLAYHGATGTWDVSREVAAPWRR